jgi:hypothetical protein
LSVREIARGSLVTHQGDGLRRGGATTAHKKGLAYQTIKRIGGRKSDAVARNIDDDVADEGGAWTA